MAGQEACSLPQARQVAAGADKVKAAVVAVAVAAKQVVLGEEAEAGAGEGSCPVAEDERLG